MIDIDKLKIILTEYKKHFYSHWNNEKYKWEAIKHFQSHWNIEAKNFAEMFEYATAKTGNLLTSKNFYPRVMIIAFAKVDAETVRQMFRKLFNENYSLSERIELFQNVSETIRQKYDDGTWKNHFQNIYTISVYIWLMFPDKYYIYKYTIYKNVATELNSNYELKHNGSINNLINGFCMYDEICDIIQKDTEIKSILQNIITDDCYTDPYLKTCTIDFGFYLSKLYLEQSQPEHWFPQNYTPEISIEKWSELLQDSSIFNLAALQIVKRIKDYGGQATCKQLSEKYGESPNFYNVNSFTLARRIAEKTQCPIITTEQCHTKWWPILYIGKKANNTTEGCFIWKLRYELDKALDKTDLSYIPLYSNSKPAIWKISHGTEATGISNQNKIIFEKRNVVVVHSNTKAKGTSKVKQGQDFINTIKKGDFFYLCYGNSIQLLGQFISEKAVPNKEIQNEWYEREYCIIAKSKDTSAYKGTQKWWTPNNNSTCIKISEAEQDLFEKLILKPYFDISLHSLFHNTENTAISKYTKQDFLAAVYMTEQRYTMLEALLKNKKNIILQGAPGVGKTFIAKKLAYTIMGEQDDSRIKMVQFHQNYSYEDFIMGYRPCGADFKLTEGTFYRFCVEASEHKYKPYFFIIDEINRGNISKIFGELLMLIEKDYRDTAITLSYNDISFSVPENLYIIGMMNTADRSLAIMDYALRRRFSFFEIEPAYYSEGFQNYQHKIANKTFDALIEQIKLLNKEIISDASLGRGFQIGHSYFCDEKAQHCTTDWLRSIVEFDIIPMLSEYWFDETENLERWKKNLRGVFDDK
ncbi:AAA family ATPase [Clostridium sp. MD294]|uniref:AAA family ATPase n=1 Tax=Clostridium sp. MD294 TaxID=97138 RepID=UPI0002CA4C3F|nr:AAA family ATPase [Clostridium sp. MD294]NDO46954.1 AAA family ATPase [Clostridium sp. MD294]USF31383.1 hypothetical protein C820_002829 [Clostridium sp. MD294]